MTTESVSKKLAELNAEYNEKAARIEQERDILLSLPGGLSPTISNISDKRTEKAWLSFHGHAYDPDKTFDPVKVLQSLEDAGWTQQPATLCKWDNYRVSPYMGMQDTVTHPRYKLTDSWPMCPVWIRPDSWKPTAEVFMRAPSGDCFHVLVACKGLPVYLTCRRVEFRGGWRYDGPATLRFPDKWNNIAHEGNIVATLDEHSKAYRDTEQGLSGAIYWAPTTDHTAFPMLASEFLKALI